MSNPFTLAACLPTLADVLARPLTPISTSRRKVVSGCRPMDVLVATKFHIPRAGSVPRPRVVAGVVGGRGRGGGGGGGTGGLRWVGQVDVAGGLGAALPVAGGVAVAGCRRQRPGQVLAVCGRGARSSAAGGGRAGRRAAG